MASTAEGCSNGPHVSPILSRAHTVIAASIAIVPHDAKRMLCREAFTDLTCQDRTVDRGNDGSVKVDGDCFRRKFVHELVFITQDGSAFLLQLLLLKLTPEVVIEWIGGNGGIDFPTGRERPSPEIFVLNIVEKPRYRLIVCPFPGQDRTRLLHVKIRIGKAGKGFLRGDVMIEHEERLRLSSHGFQRCSGIAEVHNDHSLVLEPYGTWIA